MNFVISSSQWDLPKTLMTNLLPFNQLQRLLQSCTRR
jgi:hypothetical protein